jgi:hypothetical protein
MMFKRGAKPEAASLLAFVFICAIMAAAAVAQSNPARTDGQKNLAAQNGADPAIPAARSPIPAHLSSNSVLNQKARAQYKVLWGIDDILVKESAAGALIRFSYRIVDPIKAKALNDEKSTPNMIDPTGRVALQIPEMEQVGKLRQITAPETGKVYWMVFSNKGGYVKPGNRVDIVIGNVRLRGLVVR